MSAIRTIRKGLNMTQAALAAELGCSQGNVSFYEGGQTVPPDVAQKLITLAAKYGKRLTFDDVYAAKAGRKKAA